MLVLLPRRIKQNLVLSMTIKFSEKNLLRKFLGFQLLTQRMEFPLSLARLRIQKLPLMLRMELHLIVKT